MRSPALLIDTNIWVDLELPRENYEEIKLLFNTARECKARLGIASHSLKDTATVIERRIKQIEQVERKQDPTHVGAAARAASWAAVNHILEHAEVVGSDYMDAYTACKDRVFHDYFEDNLVVAAFRRMNADVLVTNDAALQKHAPVPTLSATRAVEWLRANG